MYFHESRTSQSIKKQYNLLKKLGLLKDQLYQPRKNNDLLANPKDDKSILAITFDQIENKLDDSKISEQIILDQKTEDGIYYFNIIYLA